MLGSHESQTGNLSGPCPVHGRNCRLAKATLEVMECSHGCYELTPFEARAKEKDIDALHSQGG